MRVKHLSLMALAASMVLASCNKNENEMGEIIDMQPKKVTIKLPNITKATGSRAVGDAMTTATDRKATLENFKVFFLAGNTEKTAPSYDADGDGTAEAQPVYFSANGNIPTEITYHFLDASVDRVVVVGNLGEDITYADITTGTSATQSILNDDQNGNPLYPLYGADNLELKTSLDGDETHDNVYEATVTLAPKMSRFEIVGVGYTSTEETTAQFESLKMNKIALCHYYTQYSFASGLGSGTQTDCPANAHVWQWIDDAQSPWADAVVSNGQPTPSSISVDLEKHVNISTGEEITETDLTSPNLGDGFTDIITYGVAGVDTKDNNPELYLSFYGVKTGQDDTPLYVKGKFTAKTSETNNDGHFEAGKIYRILFTIPDGSWDAPERCVELTVDVADWTVEVLTPEF